MIEDSNLPKPIETIGQTRKAIYFMPWGEIYDRIRPIDKKGYMVYGIPKSSEPILDLFEHATIVDDPEDATFFVDDIIRSGQTKKYFMNKYPCRFFLALADLNDKEFNNYQDITFPWENN